MTIRYVGPGGSDANSGLSWALRKATLNGCEDSPVAAGDQVWVAPGTYREMLTVDVSGDSLYTTGTVSTTLGSAVVTGSGTSWTANAYVGGQFRAGEASPIQIASVDSDTQITLVKPWHLADLSGAAYKTWRDIKYIADTTGLYTDGVGGVVRITGSDNDQTATRASCITATSKSYRTFRGMVCDLTTGAAISASDGAGWVVADCTFQATGAQGVYVTGAGQSAWTIERCAGLTANATVAFLHSSTVNDAGHVVRNCLTAGGRTNGVTVTRVGGISVVNCTWIGCNYAVRVDTALAAGQSVAVNNCIIAYCTNGLRAINLGEVVEDYNSLWQNGTDRTTVNTGANSVAYPPIFAPLPLLNTGRVEPWLPFSLLPASLIRARTGATAPDTDLFGTPRPQETAISWGAVECLPQPTRETGANARGGSGTCLKIDGRGYHDILIPVSDNTATTVTVYVKWAENASVGVKPSAKLLADYGVTEQTATATGDGTTYEALTLGPVTPQVPGDGKGWIVLRLLNNSTHTAALSAYFDDVAVV